MSIADKNNPDGQGSYGRVPSRFVKRPKEKSEALPNDATGAPMDHAYQDQEVFDETQQEQARSPSPEKKTLKSSQSGRKVSQKTEARHSKAEKSPGELRKE